MLTKEEVVTRLEAARGRWPSSRWFLDEAEAACSPLGAIALVALGDEPADYGNQAPLAIWIMENLPRRLWVAIARAIDLAIDAGADGWDAAIAAAKEWNDDAHG